MAEIAVAVALGAAAFAGKTVAQATITNFVNKALDRISDKDLCRRLEHKLPNVEGILYAVEQQKTENDPSLQKIVWQFRDAIQEAQDALESLNLKNGIFSWKSSARENLKDALKKLDEVLDAKSLPQLVTQARSSSHSQENIQHFASRRETTRGLTTPVFGRLKEKDAIIDWLVQPPITGQKLSAFAIVGASGMGKTIIAQFVCQDKKVRDYYDNMIIWVHVSKIFDQKVLFRRILEELNHSNVSADSLDTLQNLSEKLMTKRFLLVLDDVWEDTEDELWEQVLGPIKNNAQVGGRILLTTRMRSVVEAVKRQILSCKYFELGDLDEKDTAQLLNHHALGGMSPGDHIELRPIGEQIAKKLKGCPLVAKLIGLHLQGNTDLARWKYILNHNILQVDEVATKIKEILRLSYQNLTYEVQVCFRYCSIFPPHYKFKMDEVVEMWVSSGLILEGGNNNREDIARAHFNTLSKKSFFALVPRELNSDPSENYYVLRDGMYELACSVSFGECSRLKDTDSNTNIPPTVRHMYVEGINAETINIISKCKYLRTLVIANEESSIQQQLANDLKESIKGRTSLRLLKLYGNGLFCMNSAIAELEHLRYIYLSATEEYNLSKLFKLYHLEVLQILKIEKENTSSSIYINLPHLQKLHLPKSTLSRIPHIGTLTTLQELNGFSVKTKTGHTITELKDLNMLQKVTVLDVQNVTNHSEASAAQLLVKSDMKLLSLEWSADQGSLDGRILNKLIPVSNLTHLVISGYNGTKPPFWMESTHLNNLVYLKLDGCVEWGKLPKIGYLRKLKHLFLMRLPKLKYIAGSSCGTGMDGSRVTNPDGLPPDLITFVVKDCWALKELPGLPFSLRHLNMYRVGMSSLPNMCDSEWLRNVSMTESGLSILNIESCESLASLDGCFIQEEHCRALTVLSLVRCHSLISLPDAEDFQRMSKLERIKIIDCKGLSSLGGLDSLSYLKVLRIEFCAKLVTASSSWFPPVRIQSSSLKLETLEIDDHLLLVFSTLRNLCLTKRLVVLHRSKMAELPAQWLLQNRSRLEHVEIQNGQLLKSLPNMGQWHALRNLLLHNTPLLQSLPVMPPNLWALVINGCSDVFYQKYQPGDSKICSLHNCHILPKKTCMKRIGLSMPL